MTIKLCFISVSKPAEIDLNYSLKFAKAKLSVLQNNVESNMSYHLFGCLCFKIGNYRISFFCLIAAMSFASEEHENTYKYNLKEVTRMLKTKHGDHYLVGLKFLE